MFRYFNTAKNFPVVNLEHSMTSTSNSIGNGKYNYLFHDEITKRKYKKNPINISLIHKKDKVYHPYFMNDNLQYTGEPDKKSIYNTTHESNELSYRSTIEKGKKDPIEKFTNLMKSIDKNYNFGNKMNMKK